MKQQEINLPTPIDPAYIDFEEQATLHSSDREKLALLTLFVIIVVIL